MPAKKHAPKKAAKKAASPLKKKVPAARKPERAPDPVRIIIEVVIRNETAAQDKFAAPVLEALSDNKAFLPLGGCPDNKFSYSFDTKKGETDHSAIIHFLKVEAFERPSPGDSGNFTACINDISDEPQVRVTVFASENMPGGRASLRLKFRGADLFSPERELDKMPGGHLGFSELVKLP